MPCTASPIRYTTEPNSTNIGARPSSGINAAATVIQELLPGKIARVVLGHLSRDCNTPALALQTVRGTLSKSGKIETELFCATQSQISPQFCIGETVRGAFQPTFENAFFPAA